MAKRYVLMFEKDLGDPNWQALWPVRLERKSAAALCAETQFRGYVVETYRREEYPRLCPLAERRLVYSQLAQRRFWCVPCVITDAAKCPEEQCGE